MGRRNYLKRDHAAGAARKKTVLIAAGVCAVLYLLLSFIFGEMGVVKYYRMKAHSLTLRQEIGLLKTDNVRLLKEVRALKTDPAYLERIARDKLGLARPGEIVYYYDVANSKSEAPGLK